MNTNTPETNEAQFGTGRVSVDFARKLERDRDAALRELAELRADNAELKLVIETAREGRWTVEEAENYLSKL